MKMFVETGCEDGEGLTFAKSYGFLESDLYSCDIRLEAVEKVSAMFPFAHVVNMDSLAFLTALLPVLRGPTMFWLDAHFCGEAAPGKNCPALLELEAIARHPIKTHTIMIDDRFTFGTAAFDGVQESQLHAKLREINPNYKFVYEMGAFKDSVIVALP